MLEVSGLNQFYGESHTLWDVEMSVPQNSCTCLMGRNGVGKTTLLRAIRQVQEFCGTDISTSRTVTVLHEGRVLAEGDMDTVQNNPDVIEVYLGS